MKLKKFVIIFYTKEQKPPEYFNGHSDDMQKLFERIVELTTHRAKFAIYEVGECVGDFS